MLKAPLFRCFQHPFIPFMFHRCMSAPSDSTKAPLEDLVRALEALSAKGFRAEIMGNRSVILVPKGDITDASGPPEHVNDARSTDIILILPKRRRIHAHAGEYDACSSRDVLQPITLRMHN